MLKFLRPLKLALKYYVSVFVILGFLFFLTDAATSFLYKPKIDTVKYEILKLLFYDFGIAAVMALVLYIPYSFISNYKEGLSRIFINIICFLLFLINLGLNAYYAQSRVPLGSDLFGYNVSELIMIVNASVSIGLKQIMMGSLVPLVFFGLTFLSRFYYSKTRYLFFTLLIGLFYLIISPFIDSNPLNHLGFFIKDTIEYKNSAKDRSQPKKALSEYPLFKVTKFENDVLGQNLNLGEQKPNIILIVVEGLGRDFMGQNAQYPGFMPYLDSLSKNSLYWSNFMSNAGRSFGALPSIIGSAPFGEQGFLDLPKLPDHYSLIQLLKKHGYYTSYFEGGDSSFDRKINYLQNEGIESLTDMASFGPGYNVVTNKENGFTWGYPDAEIFKKTLTLIKPLEKPRFDLILTISNHEPFQIPNQAFYKKKAKLILEKSKIGGEEEDNIEDNMGVFSTLIYTDESIKNFISNFKKNPTYSNSIIIITGDHRLIPIPQKDAICRYHVPLIITGPLVKAPIEFKGISSHMDIMPSILTMLEKKYKIKLEDKNPFIGSGVSSSKNFESIKDIPLMRYKGGFKDAVIGNSFVSNNDIFLIKDNLEIEENYGSINAINLKSTMRDMQDLHKYVTENNKIIPKTAKINTTIIKVASKEQMAVYTKFAKGKGPYETFMVAREFAFNKKRKDALTLVEYVLTQDPNIFDATVLRGRIYAWEGQYAVAEKEFLAVIDRKPLYQDSYRAAITMYWWMGNRQKALSLYNKAKVNFKEDRDFLNELMGLISKIK